MNLPVGNLPAAELGHADGDAALHQGFERSFALAAAGSPPLIRMLSLGGLCVRLEIAGPALAEQLLRPFRHLLIEAAPDCSFCIQAWSADETGVTIPPFPFEPRPYSANGHIAYRNQANGRAVADRAGRHILAGFDGAGHLTYSDLAKPFRSLLIPLLQDAGRQLIHGGTVAASPDAPGLLLAGRSGSGKSTVAVAALAGGLCFLGDDHVALSREQDRFMAHSLYATCGLARDHLAAFPALPGEIVTAPDRDKCVLLLAPGQDHCLVRSVALGAIVIPTIVSGAKTRTVPASRGEALRALIPGSITPRLPRQEGGRGWQFDGISDLAALLPAFRLEMGSDLAAIPAALRELSRQLVRR